MKILNSRLGRAFTLGFCLVITAVALHSAENVPGGWNKAKGKRILYFTKSAGFEHSVVKRPAPDQLSHSEKILTELGEKYGFAVTCTKDGGIFTPEKLAQFDVIVFYTSGMLTETGTDKTPAMTPAGKQALLEAINKGKGFVGIHAANDSFHFQPDSTDLSERYVLHGSKADPYIKMIGGEFIKHGPQQKATMRVVDNRFPGCEDLDGGFDSLDEWYTFKDFAPDLHVILVQETQGMQGIDYQRPPFPATWARLQGKGHVFYTSMGHREDVWTNPRFQRILLGGLGWAAGNVKAKVSPNIEKATPGYRQVQPKEQPKK
jgi:uncharacterized protein